MIKQFFKKLNFLSDCKKYKIPLYQCPNFLFIIMGLVIIAIIIFSYYVGIHYIAPELLIILLALASIILLISGSMIVSSFERLAWVNKTKSDFVSIVAHQLRSPLSSLRWSLELLGDEKTGHLSEKQKEIFEIVNKSNKRMIDLVNDLLNVCRIEEGRLKINPQEISLEEIVESVVKELLPLAKEKKVNIVLEKEKNLPLVYADPERIRMVIQNLIDNAIKYSKKEGGKVKVSLLKENNQIKFTVKDNGIGIPAILQKRVFEKFFRAKNYPPQREISGTGLGLFIAKGIIKMSGGEINFQSKEGKGSTFWFTLPIKSKK